MSVAKEELERVMRENGISVRAEFVPWSQSRKASEKVPSLNWRVTLVREGRDILTTDYTAGMGHCPAYKAAKSAQRLEHWRMEAIRAECEHGKRVMNLQHFPTTPLFREQIQPDAAEVVYSLVLDSDVLDYPDFESWAPELGFDSDSREAEKIYRDCLDLALKLRAGLGESVLAALRETA